LYSDHHLPPGLEDLPDRKAAFDAGQLTDEGELTFADFTTNWLDARPTELSDGQKVNEEAIVNYLTRVTIAEGVTLGQHPIGLLTTDIWKRVFESFAVGRAASTFNKYRQAILSMQTWAVEEGYLV
jgi:hypothetical protein